MSGSRLNNAILYAAYEYLMIVVPVGLYVILHGLHDTHPAAAVVSSPEWNIATIFLLMQGQFLYHVQLEGTGRRLSRNVMGLSSVATIVGVVFAVANIELTFRGGWRGLTLCMWLMFAVVSLLFWAFTIGAHVVARSAEGAHE